MEKLGLGVHSYTQKKEPYSMTIKLIATPDLRFSSQYSQHSSTYLVEWTQADYRLHSYHVINLR